MNTGGNNDPLRTEVEGLNENRPPTDQYGPSDDQIQSAQNTFPSRSRSCADSPGLLPKRTVLADRFRVVCLLGCGGMGEVYEAEDSELQQRVAIKIINPQIANDATTLARFRREISLARRITHSNVCRTYDIFFHVVPSHGDRAAEKLTFLSMELLVGQTLAQYLRQRGKLTAAEAVPIVLQLASGLSAAHNAGIVHRDFKPGNVQLVDCGPTIRAVITDFGLASEVIADKDDRLTDVGVMVGTPLYMAPEQVEGKPTTPATDVYALGIVMYEMLTGTCPFIGENAMEIAINRLKGPPPRPSIHLPNLEPALEGVIMRCLQVSPSARFSSAEQIIEALTGDPKDRHFGPYELLSQLDLQTDRMEAWDPHACRVVSIQRIPPWKQEIIASIKDRVLVLSRIPHPNICAVYQVFTVGETHFLAMEHLDGQTLENKMSSGPCTISEALEYATQIAEALTVAYQQGLIHGRLKPRNVFLTKLGCKINLAFTPPVAQEVDPTVLTESPNVGSLGWPGLYSPDPATESRLKTLDDLRYTPPELLQGKGIDERSDVFTLGALLFEMMTAKKAFTGDNPGAVIATLLSSDTAVEITSDLSLPYSIVSVIRRCLSRHPAQRFQRIKDVKLELQRISRRRLLLAVRLPHVKRSRISLFLFAMIVFVVAALGILWLPRRFAPFYDVSDINPPQHAVFALEEEDSLGPAAISKDGNVAYAAEKNGQTLLYVRTPNGREKELLGTDRATFPFWSPDGKWLGFFSDRMLKKVNVESGRVVELCSAPLAGRGGTWNDRGVILFGQTSGGIHRYSDDQPNPVEVTTINVSHDERSHRWPYFMPDGDHYLFLATYIPEGQQTEASTARIYIGRLSSPQQLEQLNFESESNVAFVTSPPGSSFLPFNVTTRAGYIFYVEKGSLMARKYRYSLTGRMFERFVSAKPPVRVQDNITQFPRIWYALYSVSEKNLVFQAEPKLGSKLALYDGHGNLKSVIEDDIDVTHVRFSPSGNDIAALVYDGQRRKREIWIYSRTAQGFKKRSVLDEASTPYSPVWSPDGKFLMFAMNSRGSDIKDLYLRVADGSSPSKRIMVSNISKVPTDWSRTNLLAYNIDPVNGMQTIGIYDLATKTIKMQNLDKNPARSNSYATFSPDGNLIAYQAQSPPNIDELIIRQVDESNVEMPVSRDGGFNSRWCRPAGSGENIQLLYFNPERKLMSVVVEPDGGLKMAHTLFATPIRTLMKGGYDVTSDCSEIIMSTRPSRMSSALTRELNWPSRPEFY